MGAILSFPDDNRRARRTTPPPAGETGRILLFTGVRIERESTPPRRGGPDICSPPTRRKRPNPSRIRNKA